jgi:hypothetical protein
VGDPGKSATGLVASGLTKHNFQGQTEISMTRQFRFGSAATSPTRHLRRKNPRNPDRHRRQVRRLLLEALEDRHLLAFNVLGEFAVGPYPYEAEVASIDATPGADILTANSGASSVSFLSGNGDGTFDVPPTNSTTGSSPHSLAAGDFDTDGKTDVVTASSGGLHLLLGNGDGSFQAPASIALPGQFPPNYTGSTALPQQVGSVATGDLNEDGSLDLAVTGSTLFSVPAGCGYYGCYYNYYYDGFVNVLLGNGSGGFSPATAHHLGTYRIAYAVAIGDVNGDGDNDVIAANWGDLSVLLGDGTGAVAGPVHSGSGSTLSSVSLGDVDGDGLVDTVMRDFTGYGLTVQKGNGDGTFTAQPSVNTGNYIHSAVMGDVNADGKLDLVAASSNYYCTYGWYYCYYGYSQRQANVLLGYGGGSFTLPQSFSLGIEPYTYSWLTSTVLSDLTADGRPELVVTDFYTAEVVIATNDGDWELLPAIFITDATVVEGDSGSVNAEFTISLLGPHSGGISVDYSTASWGATPGADYATTSGSVSFASGESTKKISVPVHGDLTDEYDQQFVVNLANVVGAQIADGQGIGTIQDNDAAPLVSINDVSKNEGPHRKNTNFVFEVSLSAASEKWVYVSYSTSDGTATTADSDYFAAGGTVYFSPGETADTLTVVVRGDKKREADETFNVHLTDATDGTILDDLGIGTILNDDGPKGKSGSSSARK